MAGTTATQLTTAMFTTVVTALTESLSAAGNTGSVLEGFCKAAAKAKLPAEPMASDVVAIVDAAAAKLGWNGTAREKVSKSEARNIVRQHARLPELMTALRSANGKCSYHDAVKLTRLARDNETVETCIAAFNTVKAAKESDPKENFQRAVQKFYQTVMESKGKGKDAKLESIRNMCAAIGINAIK